ncbi:MAG: imidazole glycerol phosphate synthase subunit HisF [Candidatus Caenarcaniphilales bacterium]|nr:imidazole glycerol phosphate synthase subunit HisF [Candidatus Caenarcaniphilales bacterium]
MISKRIIPCLDVDKGQVVKGVNFVNIQKAGDPVELARKYYEMGADELCFLDITASHEDRKATYEIIKTTAKEVFIPLTVGGGVSSVKDVENLLHAGADKVGMNSGAVRNPTLISEAADNFGSQCIVLAVDVKRRPSSPESQTSQRFSDTRREGLGKTELTGASMSISQNLNNTVDGSSSLLGWDVYVKGGRECTGLDALEWIKEAEQRGAGEILLTSMDADGSKAGYDIELTRAVCDAVQIPVIASGGAGNADHVIDVLKAGADAALLASILHYGETTIEAIKEKMHQASVRTRV